LRKAHAKAENKERASPKSSTGKRRLALLSHKKKVELAARADAVVARARAAAAAAEGSPTGEAETGSAAVRSNLQGAAAGTTPEERPVNTARAKQLLQRTWGEIEAICEEGTRLYIAAGRHSAGTSEMMYTTALNSVRGVRNYLQSTVQRLKRGMPAAQPLVVAPGAVPGWSIRRMAPSISPSKAGRAVTARVARLGRAQAAKARELPAAAGPVAEGATGGAAAAGVTSAAAVSAGAAAVGVGAASELAAQLGAERPLPQPLRQVYKEKRRKRKRKPAAEQAARPAKMARAAGGAAAPTAGAAAPTAGAVRLIAGPAAGAPQPAGPGGGSAGSTATNGTGVAGAEGAGARLVAPKAVQVRENTPLPPGASAWPPETDGASTSLCKTRRWLRLRLAVTGKEPMSGRALASRGPRGRCAKRTTTRLGTAPRALWSALGLPRGG
jgi:hypothetical protein